MSTLPRLDCLRPLIGPDEENALSHRASGPRIVTSCRSGRPRGADCWSDGEAEDQRHHEHERRLPARRALCPASAASKSNSSRSRLISRSRFIAYPVPGRETLASRSKGQTSPLRRIATRVNLTASRRLGASASSIAHDRTAQGYPETLVYSREVKGGGHTHLRPTLASQ
jgi:hypothetical protein